MSLSTVERRRITKQYVDLLHCLGQTVIKSRPLRDHLLVDGVDYWAASPLRESSPWHSPVFARLNLICNGTQVQQSATPTRGLVSTKIRTSLYWCINIFSSLTNRARRVQGDVVFVTFMPETVVETSDRKSVV